MCGRFTQHYSWAEVYAFLSIFGAPQNLRPHYNIAPTTSVDVVRLNAEDQRELVSMRWGLVPYWWKKPLKELPATFNARAETMAEKPMFRGAFKTRRCIIPASGFFEWTGDAKNHQPDLFTAGDGPPVLAFAGLWEKARDRRSRRGRSLSPTILYTLPKKLEAMRHDHDCRRVGSALRPCQSTVDRQGNFAT